MARILVVDDEAEYLQVIKKLLASFGHEATLASNGQEALEKLNPRMDLALLDIRMPGMSGYEIAQHIRNNPPTADLPLIMVTALGNKEDRLRAVKAGANDFIQKPVDATELKVRSDSLLKMKASQDEVKRQKEELKKAYAGEKELLEKTLRGTVRVLADILGLVSPTAFSQTDRIRRYIRQLCLRLEIPNAWQFELAAMLSQIGLITLPPDILDKHFTGAPLSAEEGAMISEHPKIAHDLLSKIPRLGLIPEMIAKQNSPFTGHLYDGQLKGRSPAAIGAQLLKATIRYDLLVSQGKSHREALAALRKSDERYDPLIVLAIQELNLDESGEPLVYEPKKVRVEQLADGMILGEDVLSRGERGILLGRKGQEVTRFLRERLKNYARKEQAAKKEVRVLVSKENCQAVSKS